MDGANPEVIRELKARIGEYHDYYGRLTEEQIWSLRSSNSWQIIPVNFQKRHREMLQWTYTLMSKRFIKIHPSLAETDSVTKNCNSDQMNGSWTSNKRHIMTYWIHLDWLYVTMSFQRVEVGITFCINRTEELSY